MKREKRKEGGIERQRDTQTQRGKDREKRRSTHREKQHEGAWKMKTSAERRGVRGGRGQAETTMRTGQSEVADGETGRKQRQEETREQSF